MEEENGSEEGCFSFLRSFVDEVWKKDLERFGTRDGYSEMPQVVLSFLIRNYLEGKHKRDREEGKKRLRT